MIKQLDKYLIGIAIGVRFRTNFSLEDKLGSFIDKVLYSKKSFFNPDVFPKVGHNLNEKILYNDKSSDTLRIDNSNIILEIKFGKTFSSDDLQNILTKFDEQIINGAMKEFEIKNINRIGLVKRYIFQMTNLAETFVTKTIGHTLEGVNDINLRFSKKLTVPKALVKEDIFDYDNAIFNIVKKADLDEIFMSIDYQKYFEPAVSSTSDLNFLKFATYAENFNEKSYLPWLNSNYVEAIGHE